MSELLQLAGWLGRRVLEAWLSPAVLINLSGVASITLLLLAVDLRTGREWKRYFSRSAGTDAVYTAFYLMGIYGFLLSGPLNRTLDGWVMTGVPWLRANLLADLPPVAHFLALVVVVDLIGYWVHRWTHASRVLWAFHSIHHSQVHLNALTNMRFHFLDTLVKGFFYSLAGLMLGGATTSFLPVMWLTLWLGSLAHSDLDWHYGPLEKLVVSPRFHRVHHSSEPGHLNANFGLTLSIWDHLFGTASERPRPARYGTPGLAVPESFLKQAYFPFLHIARDVGHRHASSAGG